MSKNIGNPFAAFKHRSYRYYWIGMAISATGTWMQNIAQPWLAYKLTDSPFLLGLVSALQFLPVLLFSLFAGVLIDRVNKKSILYITQASAFVISLALAVLTYTGHIAYWHLIIASTLLGFVNTVDMPARQSFVIELVGREDLTNGIALNSVQFNLARVLGPAIAGVIMGTGKWGIPFCFLLNAVSYGAVLVTLPHIRPYPVEQKEQPKASILKNISEGLRFIGGSKVLLITLIVLAITGTFAMNLNVLVPVFSEEVLHQKESGFGLLMSLSGVGALAGALTMAALAKGGPRPIFIFGFPVITAILVLVVGFTNAYLLTGAVLMLLSFFFMIFMSSANSTMQLNSPNEFRGRVMSIYTLVFAGTTPIGNLFAGAIAEKGGAKVSFIACGAVVLVLLLPVYLFKAYRKSAVVT